MAGVYPVGQSACSFSLMRIHGVAIGGALLASPVCLSAQVLQVDPASVAARAVLSSAPSHVVPAQFQAAPDSLHRPRLSRGAATALGFVGGAAAGLVIAHIVNQSHVGEGQLENYFGIPLGLGVFTAATVFVAMGG